MATSSNPSTSPADEGLWSAGFGAWLRVGVVYGRASRLLAQRLSPLALTVPQFDVLANLYVGDDISQQQLARRLLVTKGNVSGLMNRLSQRELTARHADPQDGRAYRIKLTERGRRLTQQALLIQRDLVNEMMGGLDDDERQVLDELLSRISGRLKRARS